MGLGSRIRCARALAGRPLEGDREALSVYADRLLGEGDMRGELLNLHLDGVSGSQHPHALELELELEHAFRERWRGLGAWRVVRSSWRAGHVSELDLHGPAPRSEPFDLRPLLRDPAFELLGILNVELAAQQREAWLDALAADPLPLTELSLGTLGSAIAQPFFDAAAGERLCSALPELQVLRARGAETFASLSHPRLRTLELDDLSGCELELPALRELSLQGLYTDAQRQELLERSALLAQLKGLSLASADAQVLHRLLPDLPASARVRVGSFHLERPALDARQEWIRWRREEHLPFVQRLCAAFPQLELTGASERSPAVRPRLQRVLLWPHGVEGRHSVWLHPQELQDAIEASWLSLRQLRTGRQLLRDYHSTSLETRELEAAPLFELFAGLRGFSHAFTQHFECFELHRDCCSTLKLRAVTR